MTMRPRSLFRFAGLLALMILIFCCDAWAASTCQQGEEVRIWIAPLIPQPGQPMRILAVATDGELNDLTITAPGERHAEPTVIQGGGPPWSLRAVLPKTDAGNYRIEAKREGRTVACAEIRVGSSTAERGAGRWDRATQALFAAWVEQLFDAPADQPLDFPSLEPVLRDPARNFLHDYLRPGEDARIAAEPDCADLPYFLRAYFAWKLGLPMACHYCDRGTADRAPRCDNPRVDLSFVGTKATAETFREMSRKLIDAVHSGSARTAVNDNATDFYPVPLERSTLWPGTIFADPYGHTLVLVKWVPQTEDQSGQLLAVDAQPDNSVARKRFWEGNFLFASTPSAGPGFKAYRPPVLIDGHWRQAPDRDLNARSGQIPYANAQAKLTPADFYAQMERLINPHGLDPETAYNEMLDALMEQLETRVRSVDNGEKYMRDHPGTVVPMPSGPSIFETTGLWEDYSTPSRDMRLLIAMKVLADLPERIRRHPELFVLRHQSAATAAEEIERLHKRLTEERSISYTRSDGSPWTLSLAEIYRRQPALEMAYNPNDCIERRWGATPDTPDFATCHRRAPAEQIAKMEEYRPWFHETRRPPR